MANHLLFSVGLLLVGFANLSLAQGPPEMPSPAPEHAWLQKLVGDWETEIEIYPPGGEVMKATGRETVRSVGGFWVVSTQQNSLADEPFTGVLTLGYDVNKNRYVGTWIDSVSGALWLYEGTVDPSGNILTLSTEGECPMNPGELSQFKEVIEFTDPDHKVFTSSIADSDGKWTPMMRITYRRVE